MGERVYHTLWEDQFTADKSRFLIDQMMEKEDFNKKLVALKVDFACQNKLIILMIRELAQAIRQAGGSAFLTDSNYIDGNGQPQAVEGHFIAHENGFSLERTGCPVIMADGLRGREVTYIPVKSKYMKRVRIATAIMEADLVISFTEITDHKRILEDIVLGSASRSGKMQIASKSKVYVEQDQCTSCGKCYQACGHKAIAFNPENKAEILDQCVICGRCLGVCQEDAIKPANDEVEAIRYVKIMEYAQAMLKGRPHYHIAFQYKGFIEEEGIRFFTSEDPLALDQAVADFLGVKENEDWERALSYGEKLGLGKRN